MPGVSGPQVNPVGILLQNWEAPGLAVPGPDSSLSQPKVSLEFLSQAWKKAIRPRCFRLKILDSNQHFSTKLGSMRKLPTDQTPLELFQNNAIDVAKRHI